MNERVKSGWEEKERDKKTERVREMFKVTYQLILQKANILILQTI